jgi:hypothetical protein
LKNNNQKNLATDQMQQIEVPVIEIVDSYGWVHNNRVIAYIYIIGLNGIQKRKLLRTKNGGYLMTA